MHVHWRGAASIRVHLHRFLIILTGEIGMGIIFIQAIRTTPLPVPPGRSLPGLSTAAVMVHPTPVRCGAVLTGAFSQGIVTRRMITRVTRNRTGLHLIWMAGSMSRGRLPSGTRMLKDKKSQYRISCINRLQPPNRLRHHSKVCHWCKILISLPLKMLSLIVDKVRAQIIDQAAVWAIDRRCQNWRNLDSHHGNQPGHRHHHRGTSHH